MTCLTTSLCTDTRQHNFTSTPVIGVEAQCPNTWTWTL